MTAVSWELYLTIYALFFTMFGVGLTRCYDLTKEHYRKRWGGCS